MQNHPDAPTWDEYDRELAATCPCYAQGEEQPQCWTDDVKECQGNPELHRFAAWWDALAAYEQMIVAHRAMGAALADLADAAGGVL
jgi:hypothetical protein